jgi:hypothetical protein
MTGSPSFVGRLHDFQYATSEYAKTERKALLTVPWGASIWKSSPEKGHWKAKLRARAACHSKFEAAIAGEWEQADCVPNRATQHRTQALAYNKMDFVHGCPRLFYGHYQFGDLIHEVRLFGLTNNPPFLVPQLYRRTHFLFIGLALVTSH